MKIKLNSTFLTLLPILFVSASWAQAQDSTRASTSADNQNREEKIKECVEQLKEKRDSITDYSARKACTDHVEKQANRSSDE